MTTTTRQTAMFHQTIPTSTRRILAAFDKTNSAANQQIAFDKMTATATRQIFSMPNETIPAAIRSISRLIGKLAQKLRFLALAAALAFLSLNLSATPLHDAAKNGNVDEVNRLIAAGADVNAKEDEFGATPLHFASRDYITEALLAAGADVNAKDNNGHTPLHLASFNSLNDIAAVLLIADAEVNARNNSGWTPLHWAGSADMASRLIIAGANVNAKNSNEQTPLHVACYRGFSPSIVEALLVAGANVNAKDNNGQTPLHLASNISDDSTVQVLLDAGADVNAMNNNGQTPLHLASNPDHSSWPPGIDFSLSAREGPISALLAAGANVNARDKSEWTPLHQITSSVYVDYRNIDYHQSIIDAMLAAGADANAKSNTGWTPLHMAFKLDGTGSPDVSVIVNALLAAGADVNAKSNTGWTPLHMAVSDKDYPSRKSIDALIAAGADVNTVNNNGETPLDVGLQYGSGDARLLNSLIGPSKVDLTVMTGSPAPVSASALTIERVGEERTEVRWKDGVLQFSPEANGEWRDVILDQGFFRLKP